MKKISFIGAGAMAESLISGWLKNQYLKEDQITVTNRANDRRLKELTDYYGIKSTRKGEELISPGTIVILACKPKDWASALSQFIPFLGKETPVVSVMAGVSTSSIEAFIDKINVPIIRTMPNTSATVGASMTTISYGTAVSDSVRKSVNQLFQGVGETAEVLEEQMDAMTALTGTGPAYIYYLMEAMELAAEKMGIDSKLAKILVSQTLLGASKRVQESEAQPAQLYKQIMSPGGTTEAGFEVLKENKVQEAIVSCILRAWERSIELGESTHNAVTKEKTGYRDK
ncbi:pyrroline-5-carboxylate reductase [Evansella vedderi]|uniref:Pyrroline-5-carboxylate reductase n=1 Tax=Evansella vedderi TaxID=38282 RepID=A0ABU0A1F4_9BACI|nr:pyrroline-5-carboxylate reductase [Evansella vedderi]MDQ0256180.1 pyrroline-5-carboxylate reductase [Evansella vedderi]